MRSWLVAAAIVAVAVGFARSVAKAAVTQGSPSPALTATDTDGALRRCTFTCRTMGTYANITLFTSDSVASAPLAHEAQREFVWVDSLMSNWTTTSEVARLNREAWPGPI